MTTLQEKEECDMCCEFFNNKLRRKICCPYCAKNYCLKCVRMWVLTLDITPDNSPYCMDPSCNKPWSDVFFSTTTPRSFFNVELAERRAEIALNHEMSLLPSSMSVAAVEKKRETSFERIEELKIELKEINKIRKEKLKELSELKYFVNVGSKNISEVEYEPSDEPSSLGVACPLDGCNGFLNRWKCSMCETAVCRLCRAVKDIEKEHVCDEADVESTTMVNRETKACPKCHVKIYRIDGCAHMFCPMCHTGFNWDTCRELREGQNTNPLYYEWIRSQGRIGNNTDNGLCGGIPTVDRFCLRFEKYDIGISSDEAFALYQVHNHNQQIELPKYRSVDDVNLNLSLRVKYIMGKLDKKTWVSKLKASYKSRQKTQEVYQVLENHNMIMNDVFIEIGTRHITYNRFAELYFMIIALRTTTNNALDKLRKRFKVVIPLIDIDFQIKSAKLTSTGEVVITGSDRIRRSR